MQLRGPQPFPSRVGSPCIGWLASSRRRMSVLAHAWYRLGVVPQLLRTFIPADKIEAPLALERGDGAGGYYEGLVAMVTK